MDRTRNLALAVAAVLAGGLVMPATAGAVEAADDPLRTDLALVAADRGWTLEQAQAHHAVSEVFGTVQERVATARPGLFAGARLAATPGGAPTLYVKGRADGFVRDTVAAAGIRIAVEEDRPYSWLELEARSIRLAEHLSGLGFRQIVTSFEQATALVEGTVTRVSAAPATPEQVLAVLPTDLRDDVRLTLTDADVAVPLSAFGGMRVRDDGVNECTSGWSVTNGVTTGVSTAGHCNGINEIVHGAAIHALTHQGEHEGVWGDVEWKTSTQVEPDDFHATAVEVRDVSSVEPRAGIVVGEGVCVYGRSSNFRDCDSVFNTSFSCSYDGHVHSRLVAMLTDDTTLGGDSGGGWSLGNRAYGSVAAHCNLSGDWRNAWSVADLYDEALGVSVRTV